MDDIQIRHDEIETILSYYPVQTVNATLYSDRGGRELWAIDTDSGPMLLKKELRKPEKVRFIANAHRHLQENGLAITKLIETNEGQLCVNENSHSYTLYERHTGDSMNYYDIEHLKQAMAFKADFHEKSKGYTAPHDSKIRRRLGKWDKLYRWRLQELEGFKLIAAKQTGDAFSLLFLQHVDHMLELGRQAAEEIEHPDFQVQVNKYLENGIFCEQDFTLSRLILKNGKAFMKELRSVNIDLPTRDLRIFINKVMKKLSVWDDELCCEMLAAYDNVQPLDKEDFQTLWTELRFPHLFCSVAQNYYLREKKAWSDDKYAIILQKVIDVESSKNNFLNHSEEMVEKIKGG